MKPKSLATYATNNSGTFAPQLLWIVAQLSGTPMMSVGWKYKYMERL